MSSSNVCKFARYLLTWFTRYNNRAHPLPFMKASNILAPIKGPKDAPDLEEAIEEDDDEEVVAEEQADAAEAEEGDITKDKYIKKPKGPKGDAPKKAAAKRGKNAGDEEDMGSQSVEEAKPKKARVGKAKGAAAKGKAKK